MLWLVASNHIYHYLSYFKQILHYLKQYYATVYVIDNTPFSCMHPYVWAILLIIIQSKCLSQRPFTCSHNVDSVHSQVVVGKTTWLHCWYFCWPPFSSPEKMKTKKRIVDNNEKTLSFGTTLADPFFIFLMKRFWMNWSAAVKQNFKQFWN